MLARYIKVNEKASEFPLERGFQLEDRMSITFLFHLENNDMNNDNNNYNKNSNNNVNNQSIRL